MAQTERPSEWNDASPRLPRLLVITLGVLSIAMVPGVFATTANPSGALLGAAPYFAIVLCLILGMRWRGAFVDTIFAGAAPAAIFVLGLGSLVVFEVARLAGNGGVPKLWTFVGGTAMGLYLAPGLTALAAAGISRPWLPIGAMLLLPMVIANGSSFVRSLVAGGATALNYTLLTALFVCYASSAWRRIRAKYAAAVDERQQERREHRQQESKQPPATENDAQQARVELEKAALKEQLERDLAGVGVALSGGGHRAALFDLGVLLYLVRAGRHRDIAQVSSVSGGSMTNGYVARSVNLRSCSQEEFDQVAGRFAGQLADRGTLFAFWQAWAYVAALMTSAFVALGAFALWIRPPLWLPHTWLVPAAAVATFALVGHLLLKRGAVCKWAFRKSLFSTDNGSVQLSDLSAPPIHVFCATELQTGSGAYFLNAPFVVTRDAGLSIEFLPTVVSEGFQTTVADLELAAAVQASAALPGAFPPVELPIRGFFGITRRAVSRTWERRPPATMVLVDGGVRDNLGVEWFVRQNAAPTTLLVVVNGAANRVRGRPARIRFPWLGDLRALLFVKDLPYNSREQNRRQELLTRFIPSYRGETADISGAILHIEESPCDLAEAVTRSSPEVFDSWMLTPEDIRVVDALRRRSDFDAIYKRAEAVQTRMREAEDVNRLREERVRDAKSEARKMLASVVPAGVLVSEEWSARAFHNSTLPTHLNRTGRLAAARLMRHSFALAMAKLHILFDFRLCELPSEEELMRLMDTRGPAANPAKEASRTGGAAGAASG